MKSVGSDIKSAYNCIAKKYDEALWADMPYNNQINKFLSILNGRDIIDLGCAIGSFTKYVADKGYSIEGVDFSENMIDIAKEKVKNANFYVMDMLNLKLAKKYDGIMAINSIIQIEKRNMLKLLKSIYKRLKHGGILFLIFQEGNGELYVKEPLDENIEEFVNLYTTEEIEKLFKKSKLKVIGSEKIRDNSQFTLFDNQLVYYLKKY